MKLIPAPGPERTRLFVLIVVLAAAVAIYYWKYRGEPAPMSTAAAPQSASNLSSGRGISNAQSTNAGAVRAGAPGAADVPEPLKLEGLEQVPDEPAAGRNLFRFGVRLPPPPPPSPPVQVPQIPPPPPAPTGPPPIQLRLTTLLVDTDGRTRAYLADPSGPTFEAIEGQIIDGRYRLVKVGASSVVVSYLDGTGQRTLVIGGK